MKRLLLTLAVAAGLTLPLSSDAVAPQASKRCNSGHFQPSEWPGWLRPRRATVLVDSVLLSGLRAIRSRRRCWRLDVFGRPALMIRFAESGLRRRGRPVARLVVVGIGYNSLWERGRRRYGVWAERFDNEARKLLRTLRRLGARQVVWVTLREPTRRTVPPQAQGELSQYSWYFPYVNERLRLLDQRRDDLVLADWTAASDRPGVTYDTIHVNSKGAGLMARTIWGTVSREARRQAGDPAPSAAGSQVPWLERAR